MTRNITNKIKNHGLLFVPGGEVAGQSLRHRDRGKGEATKSR